MSTCPFSTSLIPVVVSFALVTLISQYCESYLPFDMELNNMLPVCRKPRYKCIYRRGITNMTFSDKICACDSACNTYLDCCVDMTDPWRTWEKIYNCIHIGNSTEYQGVFAITDCPEVIRGSERLRQNCEHDYDIIRDPLLAVPVTDMTDHKTYRNLQCAACNRANLSNLVFWDIVTKCHDVRTTDLVSQGYFIRNLAYSGSTNEWGFNYINCSMKSEEFHPCKLEFVVPKRIKNGIRYCKPDLISTCPRGYTYLHYLEKCYAHFQLVLYAAGRAYKNPYCALCNNVDPGGTSCTHPDVPEEDPSTTLSIIMMVDASSGVGTCVGSMDGQCNCHPEEKWDPFYKRCRNLLCSLPGFSFAHGECQRNSRRGS